MGKSVEDLKAMRDELIERRRKEAYGIASSHHDDRIAKVAQIHLAISAIDVVIAEGKDEADADVSAMIV